MALQIGYSRKTIKLENFLVVKATHIQFLSLKIIIELLLKFFTN